MKRFPTFFAAVALACAAASPVPAEPAKSAPERAKAMVAAAAASAEEHGIEHLIQHIQDFRDGDLYVFVLDADGVVAAHPVSQKLVGMPLNELLDPDGRQLNAPMLKVAASNPQGGWVDYRWTKPGTQEAVTKFSYVVRRGEHTIGAGIHWE